MAAAGLAGIGHYGLVQESPLQRQVAQWAGPETSLSNDGLSLALPASWRVPKAGQTAVAAPPGTKAVLGDVRLGGLAYVMSEDAPRGVTSLDAITSTARSRAGDRKPPA